MTPDELAVGFVHRLRAEGLDVPIGSALVYVRALAAVDVTDGGQVYWAGRAALLRRREDIAAYDRAFVDVWRRELDVGETLRDEVAAMDEAEPSVESAKGSMTETMHAESGAETDGRTHVVRASAIEVLRNKDFARCSNAELDEARRLIADLRVTTASRRSRRYRPARGRDRAGSGPDVRTTVRRSMRTGGEIVVPSRRRPAQRPRKLVLLLDVSGSMDPYARLLIRFANVAVAARRRGEVEVFALGTRLSRLTRALRSHDPDEALAMAAQTAVDWSGGTRLGEGLRSFNDGWGVRGLARGAVVVILSDGWDRGDPEMLAEQMARLRRVARRVIWVNPLKASAGYEPLARGMVAALPYVDEFVEGHSLAALDQLAATVSGA